MPLLDIRHPTIGMGMGMGMGMRQIRQIRQIRQSSVPDTDQFGEAIREAFNEGNY